MARYILFYLAALHDIWDLRAPARDQTHMPAVEASVLIAGLPGKFTNGVLKGAEKSSLVIIAKFTF